MKTVLIVEDHSHMRELLGMQVEITGLAVILAKDGKEGYETATSRKPDLIIMDIMMPQLDGWEAIRRLRAHPQTRDIPILVSTALFRDADLKACVEAGCSDYLVKPFTLAQLQDKVRQLLV